MGHTIEYGYVEDNGKIIAVDVFIDDHLLGWMG